MKKNQLLQILVLACFLFGCAAKETTGVWVNKEKIAGKSFHNLFIIVMTADIQARVQLEKELEAVALSRGLKVVKSIDVMEASARDPKTPTKDEIVAAVQKSGCDAVFISSLLKQEEALTQTAATTTGSYTPYYTYQSVGYAGYYSSYSEVYRPGYYTHDKKYVMQSNLYDAVTQDLLWSAQSEVFNPESLTRFSQVYVSTLMKQLDKAKLLKK